MTILMYNVTEVVTEMGTYKPGDRDRDRDRGRGLGRKIRESNSTGPLPRLFFFLQPVK